MHKIAKIALALNLILGLLFLISSFSLWLSVNSEYPYLTVSHWSPFMVVASHYYVNADGTFDIAQGIFLSWNFPFWIFLILLIVNLYFIIKISKAQQSTLKN